MGLKAVLDSLDGHDDIKSFYRERDDGKFVLDVDSVDGYALEDVKGLKGTLEKERQGRVKSERDLKAAREAYGEITPDKAKEHARRVEEMKNWSPDEKAKELIAERERAVTSKFEKQLGEEKDVRERLTKQLGRELVDSRAAAAIATHRGNPGMLLPFLREQSTVAEDENGNLQVRILDSDGTPRVTMKTGETGYMGYEEFVEGLVESDTWGAAFAGPDVKGTGSQGSESNSGGNQGNTIRAQDGVVMADPDQVLSGDVTVQM